MDSYNIEHTLASGPAWVWGWQHKKGRGGGERR
jgi:hypothetical protein